MDKLANRTHSAVKWFYKKLLFGMVNAMLIRWHYDSLISDVQAGKENKRFFKRTMSWSYPHLRNP